MAIIPIPGIDRAVKVAQGAVRAIGNPSSAFDRAAASVANRSSGAPLVGVVRSAVRAANTATGGAVARVGELLGVVEGSPETEQTPRGSVIGKVGGIAGAVLRSGDNVPQWGYLSPKRMATLVPVTYDGTIIQDQGSVIAPATDVQFEATLNWQSPFEASGPESKAPALMAMIQTGQISTLANALQMVLPENLAGDYLRDVAQSAGAYAQELRGRTGITKLNSHQVFSGMPPIKITLVLHLKAMTDPETEVLGPYQRLLEWSLPQQLAEAGVLNEVITNRQDMLKALFPSIAPTLVGFSYANNRFSRMVIENISAPLDGPMDSSGKPVYRSIQLTLATLTALDRNDVATMFTRT